MEPRRTKQARTPRASARKNSPLAKKSHQMDCWADASRSRLRSGFAATLCRDYSNPPLPSALVEMEETTPLSLPPFPLQPNLPRRVRTTLKFDSRHSSLPSPRVFPCGRSTLDKDRPAQKGGA